MDPHSRLSQFNQRKPKSGPKARPINTLPPPHPPSMSHPLVGSSSLVPHDGKRPYKSKSRTGNHVSLRPIASNARVRQRESLRRDMYLAFINNALQEKAQGISGPFDELVNQFNFKSSLPNSPSQIRSWISALSHVVSRLERAHSSLVEAIVNMPWTLLDSSTVKKYTVFIGMLLSARPEYLSLVLGKIVQGFTHQSSIQVVETFPSLPSSSSSSSPPAKGLTRRIIYDRLHYLLAHILSLIPTLPSTLQPFLVTHFPHKRQNHFAQLTYIRNILRVSTYCPELSDKILATIVDRAIQIDVEIQVELEELEEEEDENGIPDHNIFDLDPFDVLVGQEGNGFDSDAEGSGADGDSDVDDDGFSDISSDAGDLDLDREHIELPTNVKHIQDMVKKLDGILTLVFEHFKKGLEGGIQIKRSKSMSDLDSMSPLDLPPLPASHSHFIYPAFDSLSSSSMPSSPSPSLPPLPSSPFPAAPDTLKTKPHSTEHLHSQFHTLLSIFDRTILSTFKSRYTQFLVFWYASLDPDFVDIFQGMLVERALFGSSDLVGPNLPTSSSSSSTNTTPDLTRAAAASYIGSFVSRAKFVDRESTRRVVGVLCEYLQAYLDGVDDSLRAYTESDGSLGAVVGATSQHVVFYAVAQAVLLIFCFRWRELIVDEEEEEERAGTKLEGEGQSNRPEEFASISISARIRKDKWISELGVLKRVVMSVLNPLKVCSPGVVMQFARVAHQTDFVYCYSILESNKRNSPPQTNNVSSSVTAASTSGSSFSQMHSAPTMTSTVSAPHTLMHPTLLRGELNNEINTFFPFDPYRLPKSGTFIQEVYREWDDVALDGDESDSDSDSVSDSDGGGSDSDDLGEEGTSGSSVGGHLAIPIGKKAPEDGVNTDDGLGESLNAMSISPAFRVAMEGKVSASVGSTMVVSVS